MNFVKVNSTSFDKFKRRLVKFLLYGKDDVRETEESAPYGLDSNPIKGMTAIYGRTDKSGDDVIIGYLNQNQLADVGEFRAYSTDSNGGLKTSIWLKNDGTIEVGGNSNHLARFEKLKEGFDKLVDDFNDHLTAFNSHMHPTAGTGPPSPPTPGAGIPATPSTASIDDAKIDEIKTL